MAWIDDRIWCHPKVTDVSVPARWIWVASIAYSAGMHTGGALTAGQQSLIGSSAKVRRELVAARLWDDVDGTDVQVHDWDNHNSQRDEKRAQARDRKRRSRMTADGGTLSERDWAKARRAVFARDLGFCTDCGETDEKWHADHVPDRDTLRAQGVDLCDIDHIETRCVSCHGRRTNTRNQMRTSQRTSQRTKADKHADVTANGTADSRGRGRAPDDGSEGSEGKPRAVTSTETSRDVEANSPSQDIDFDNILKAVDA